MPNGIDRSTPLPYDLNTIYSVPPTTDFIGPQLPGFQEGSFTEEDLVISGDDILDIATSTISEGVDQAKDLVDQATDGLTKVYTQIYYLAGFGLFAWIYSSYKK